ncbi:MAG TPA: ABC transporter ATP-binding protein [Candidatus Binatia bacterium]|nr:ABC transporter ATP-binding protein [Candidatus Binatia bacterium]
MTDRGESGRVPAEAAVEVTGLVKRYDGRTVLHGISFSCQPGTIHALLGPNGAGKTTTVEILEGYRRPDGGAVRILGHTVGGGGRRLRARVGIMLQGGGFPPLARPIEILELYAALFRAPERPRALLGRLDLESVARTPYRALSGGERQRLALAVALVGRPELLVLDEPTAGMDPAAKVRVRELLGDLRRGGATILLTSHDLADVERLADWITVLDRGRIVADGSRTELLAGASPVLRFRISGGLDEGERADLGSLLGGRVEADAAPDRFRLVGPAATPELVARLAAWAAERDRLLAEVRAGAEGLEAWYLDLLAREDVATEDGER